MDERSHPDCRMLSVRETLERIIAALCVGGEGMRANKHDPFASLDFEDSASWSDRAEALRRTPDWTGEAGALSRGGDSDLIVWLAPRAGLCRAFPSQLVLRLGPGRHRVITWDTGKAAVTGSEICFGNPTVSGPPFGGRPLIMLVTGRDTA